MKRTETPQEARMHIHMMMVYNSRRAVTFDYAGVVIDLVQMCVGYPRTYM